MRYGFRPLCFLWWMIVLNFCLLPVAGVMKRLDRVWNQTNLSLSTKIRIYSICVLAVLLYGSETWTLTQPDWRRLDSFHTRCQRRILHIRWYDYITNEQVFSRPHLSSANEGLDCSVTLPDSPMMFQQTRSLRPVAKLKTVSGHHPTGGVLEVDLSPHGSIRSAGAREYRWLMLSSWLGTDRFGGKSQRRDATADRFASRWYTIGNVQLDGA